MSDSSLQDSTPKKEEKAPEVKPSAEQPKPKRNYKTARKIFFGLIGAFALFVIGFIIFAAQDLPSLSEIENPRANLSTQLISADGKVLQNLYTDQNRISINLNEVSPHLINALIATEDARFYGHAGVDPVAPFSILKDVVFSGRVRGGSTVTQQLARNLYDKKVGKERSAIRKLKEMIVSWILERKFTKQEILQAYLNTVNIYGNAYGIEVASQRLFDKRAKDLTVEEAALAIGILKGQGYYNPYTRQERATNRRNTVINLMVHHGFLNPDSTDVDSIKNIPLDASLSARQEQDHIKGLAPYFREHVRQKLKDWCEQNGYDLYTDGLRVYTTIDSRMQQHAEMAVQEHLTDLQKDFEKHIKGREPYRKDPTILERLKRQSYRYIAAKKADKSTAEINKEFDTPRKMTIFSWEGEIDTTMTPMDFHPLLLQVPGGGAYVHRPHQRTGESLGRGPNYKHFKYDHVATGARQVGSTFKPFFYATAVKEGLIKPCDEVLNQRVSFPLEDGTYWEPKNSDASVGGKITLRRGTRPFPQPRHSSAPQALE
jgi:penicillin-binding protein 1A